MLSRSVVSNSLQPHGLWTTRLLCPWDSPGKNTGVVAISSSRGSSQPRSWTQVSHVAGRFFTSWATRGALRDDNACLWKCRFHPCFSLSSVTITYWETFPPFTSSGRVFFLVYILILPFFLTSGNTVLHNLGLRFHMYLLYSLLLLASGLAITFLLPEVI